MSAKQRSSPAHGQHVDTPKTMHIQSPLQEYDLLVLNALPKHLEVKGVTVVLFFFFYFSTTFYILELQVLENP